MTEKTQFGSQGPSVECSAFEARLTELMDGTLAATELAGFRTHAESCESCGPLFVLAQQGQEWMSRLDEVEPPAYMVHNILARTSMAAETAKNGHHKVKVSWGRRLADSLSPRLVPSFQRMMQPRMAMTFSVAFFSITLGMSMMGVKVSDLGRMNYTADDLSTGVSMKYHETTSQVVKYYENLRFVYQLESGFQQLKNAMQDQPQDQQKAAPAKDDQKKQDDKKDKKQKNKTTSGVTPQRHRSARANDEVVLSAARATSLRAGNDRATLS